MAPFVFLRNLPAISSALAATQPGYAGELKAVIVTPSFLRHSNRHKNALPAVYRPIKQLKYKGKPLDCQQH
jgi:hypothetical protein